jgi:hypothetical protein
MKLIQDDKVDGVSLTGSYQAGVQIGTAAGSRIKRQVLELGGSDPFIVLDDADLDKTAQGGRAASVPQRGPDLRRRKKVHRDGVGGAPLHGTGHPTPLTP